MRPVSIWKAVKYTLYCSWYQFDRINWIAENFISVTITLIIRYVNKYYNYFFYISGIQKLL